MKREQWKPIKGYEGLYEISSYGRVKSLYRIVVSNTGKQRTINEKILTNNKRPKHANSKYFIYSIKLNKNGISKRFKIHRLVGQYVPNPFNLPYMNHIDGDPLNNYHLNLEWVSHRENMCHCVDKTKTSSQYIGVSYSKKDRVWRSEISVNTKRINLGSYNNELTAYQARCTFEKENNIINKYL
jgi:hypothetical protein